MNRKMLDAALRVALTSVRQAGIELKKIYNRPGRIESSLKSKHQVVTIADKIADRLIIKNINKNFPDHDILSEEAGIYNNNSSEYLWVVDPLDGTTNFTIKNPIFSTTLALVFRGEIVLGVIFAPVLQELYIAIKGRGATYNGKKISVSQVKNVRRGFHTYCYGSGDHRNESAAARYYQKMFLQGNEIRQLGAATIEFARVARGITESIVIPGAHIWDVATGALLVKEAGGRVTDFKNKHWCINSGNIIASNGLIHKQLLKVINAK